MAQWSGLQSGLNCKKTEKLRNFFFKNVIFELPLMKLPYFILALQQRIISIPTYIISYVGETKTVVLLSSSGNYRQQALWTASRYKENKDTEGRTL